MVSQASPQSSSSATTALVTGLSHTKLVRSLFTVLRDSLLNQRLGSLSGTELCTSSGCLKDSTLAHLTFETLKQFLLSGFKQILMISTKFNVFSIF